MQHVRTSRIPGFSLNKWVSVELAGQPVFELVNLIAPLRFRLEVDQRVSQQADTVDALVRLLPSLNSGFVGTYQGDLVLVEGVCE